MPQKLEIVLKHVEEINNGINRQLIKDYHQYLIARDTGTNYQKRICHVLNYSELICHMLNYQGLTYRNQL